MFGPTTRCFVGCLVLLLMTQVIRGQSPPDYTLAYSQANLQEKRITAIPDSFLAKSEEVLPTSLSSTLIESEYSSHLEGEVRKVPLKKLTAFGYLRLPGYGRNMTDPYPNLAPYTKAYGIGDGYREPNLSLTLTARPNGKSSFATELFFFTPYLGTGPADNVFTMNLGINFYGNFRTKVGRFGVRAGGIHWHTMSAFTMGNFQVLDRYSIYERTPWEGVRHTEKYQSYYETGAINRGDARWNNRAFQGVIFDGAINGGWAFSIMYGKTQPNGGLRNNQMDPLATIINPRNAGNVPTYAGFAGDNRLIPNLAAGGRLEKTFNSQNKIAYNALSSWTYLDSISDDRRAYQVHTLSYDLMVGELNVSGEVGAGSFSTPEVEQSWGEALMLKLSTPKKYTGLPMSLQFYQVGANYYNENGEILTFSNPKIQNAVIGQTVGQGSSGGALTLVGQMAHNRRGANFNTGIKLGNLSLNLGLGVAKELEALSTDISYDHRINGLAMTRIYNPFPAGATGPTIIGPYGRVFAYFRGIYERIHTTDIDPATAGAKFKKVFNAADIQAKYKVDIPDHDLFLFYLGSFQSARRNLGLFPVFQEDTYVLAQYHELDIYFELFPNIILTGYGGMELIKGGIHTELGETLLPRNQIGRAIGGGFDWTIAENAGLYFRRRWMKFEDKSFELDHYSGTETTIELKIYF